MRNRLLAHGAIVVLALCALLGGPLSRAAACSLDQKPSVLADGHLALINDETPTTQAQLATWAFFAFDHSYGVRQAIVLSEDRREVAKTLTAAAMRRPWRWRFGDGQTAYGWTVRHAYAHPGQKRIEVDAYDPSTKRWYNFDQVLISIQR